MELIAQNLVKKYPQAQKNAVDGLSLHLKKGVYGLLGANGAGKTTLMRMLCGILRPESGTIALDGMDVSTEGYRAFLGYLPQDFGYYPEFTGMDFLLYLSALKGLDKRQAREEAQRLLSLVSLAESANRKIRTFSGGMKQRLGIAQSLLNNPEVLVLDEPTAGLDPKERVKFRNIVSKLGNDRIVLLSTHIVSDVEHIADVILLMKDGAIIHKGSLEEIIQAIEGKVWECTVDSHAAERLMGQYPALNVREEKEGTFLRLVCGEKPAEHAVQAAATLEDLYLYYFSGEGQM